MSNGREYRFERLAAPPGASPAIRIHVDFVLCESNGVCVGIDPEIFELGDDDNLTVLMPEVALDRATVVREAVRRCPRQAISLDESTLPSE
jgi:ferredoxin